MPYDLVWLVRSVTKEKEKNVFPEQIRLVGYGSKQALKELASAKIWIDNQRKNYFLKRIKKKRGAILYSNLAWFFRNKKT